MPRLLLSAWLLAALALPTTAVAKSTLAGRHGHTAAAAGVRHVRAQRAATDRLAARDPAGLATTLAERYWGAVPCGGQVAVLSAQPLAAGTDATTDAWVTFQSPLGANDLQAPASTYTACTISLARWQWPTRARQAADWNMLCLTVVHELGHLLGHPHSLAPGSVMAAVFTDEENVPAICRENRVPVEASAGLTAAG
ncbi:MAG TPA: matrixin family metalloprotease [Solirubrobacteraceae bacterium]|nr:matrixin family metalloprotease [Solirubrobacteraceae bacterium]